MEERFALETGEGRAVVSLAEEKRRRAEEAFECAKGLLDAMARKVTLRSVPDSDGQELYEAAQNVIRAGVQPRRIKHKNI